MTQPQTQLVQAASAFLMTAGYDPSCLVSEYRFTWRTEDGTLANEVADLVAFADRPYSMRSACIAVNDLSSASQTPTILARLAYLSVPVALIATPTDVALWSIRRDLEPVLLDRTDRAEWTSATFRSRLADLGPSALLAAKQGTAQLTFVDAGLWDWAEKITADTLVRLLEGLLARSLESLATSVRSSQAAQRAIVRLVFQLFACRVLEDKGVITADLNPDAALAEAHAHFSENIDQTITTSRYVSDAIVNDVHQSLKSRFAFASLTTEMLGQAYENALVTPQFRKQQGIYYTPPSITKYILRRLPIEGIEQDERILVDPACGSGSFLLAGFERLNTILPAGWSPGLRHQYLRSRILGFDTDAFAREVATLSLLLADLQNKNGWKIREADVTSLDVKTAGGKRPTIVVTNPPFKEIKEGQGVRRELAADIMVRLVNLLEGNGLMGIVLPQSVLVSRAGRESRDVLLAKGELLEVATFPGGVFYSHADTAVVLFRKHSDRPKSHAPAVTIRELRAQDLSRFEQLGSFTRTYSADAERWRSDQDRRFVISPLFDLWQRVEGIFEPLKTFAAIKAGLQVKATDKTSVSSTKRRDDVAFVDRLQFLRPFALLTDAGYPPQWLHYGPQLHRQRDEKIFKSKKILVNANRNPGSPWRLVAAEAPANLYFSLNFHGLVLKPNALRPEHLIAILNSPVANAWIDAQTRGRWINVETLGRLPIPIVDPSAADILSARVRELHRIRVAQLKSDVFADEYADAEPTAARLLVEIDEIIYDSYRLSKRERGDVESVMRPGKRPR